MILREYLIILHQNSTQRKREIERGMDALNSTKPDDHRVGSPTRVLLHLSILSINIGFTLSCHFFYNFLLEVAV